jgi:Na+-driven multidrug efflux pump
MFPFAGITIVLSTSFQALGKAQYSLITSIVRQLVVLLPVAYLLSIWRGIDALWYAFVIAEVVGMILVIWMYKGVFKHIDWTKPDNANHTHNT